MQKKQDQKQFDPEYIFVTVFPLRNAPDMLSASNRNGLVYHTLISTSTPLGSSSFISASIVFDDEL